MDSGVPNPYTPLVFLPADTAKWYENTRYFTVGATAMYIWDVLSNLRGDYILLFKYQFRLPTAVYFFSRISVLLYVVVSSIFVTAEIPDCQKLNLANTIAYSLSVSSTSFLFFLRVRGIFLESKIFTCIFGLLWLATASSTTLIPIGSSASHIGPTHYCIRDRVKPYGVITIIMQCVYDTLVFTSISYQLIRLTSTKTTMSGRISSFFIPGDLPAFSRALLRSGQQYYFIAVGIHIVAMAFVLLPRSNPLPKIAHSLFTVPNVALSNVMACRVHRDLKFGKIDEPSVIHSSHIQEISRINWASTERTYEEGADGASQMTSGSEGESWLRNRLGTWT